MVETKVEMMKKRSRMKMSLAKGMMKIDQVEVVHLLVRHQGQMEVAHLRARRQGLHHRSRERGSGIHLRRTGNLCWETIDPRG